MDRNRTTACYVLFSTVTPVDKEHIELTTELHTEPRRAGYYLSRICLKPRMSAVAVFNNLNVYHRPYLYLQRLQGLGHMHLNLKG